MKQKLNKKVWTMAIASTCIAMSITACNNVNNMVNSLNEEVHQETPNALYACGSGHIGIGTLSKPDVSGIIFTDEDIEWLDINTRELRFRISPETLNKQLQPFNSIEFHLGEDPLFVANFVNLIISRTFDDLVLCYGKIDGDVADNGRYYIYDCYPLQLIDTDIVKANRAKRAAQWELFTKYLECKGKLRK